MDTLKQVISLFPRNIWTVKNRNGKYYLRRVDGLDLELKQSNGKVIASLPDLNVKITVSLKKDDVKILLEIEERLIDKFSKKWLEHLAKQKHVEDQERLMQDIFKKLAIACDRLDLLDENMQDKLALSKIFHEHVAIYIQIKSIEAVEIRLYSVHPTVAEKIVQVMKEWVPPLEREPGFNDN